MSPVQVFSDDPTQKDSVCFLDILSDPIPDKHYKKSEVHTHSYMHKHMVKQNQDWVKFSHFQFMSWNVNRIGHTPQDAKFAI